MCNRRDVVQEAPVWRGVSSGRLPKIPPPPVYPLLEVTRGTDAESLRLWFTTMERIVVDSVAAPGIHLGEHYICARMVFK